MFDRRAFLRGSAAITGMALCGSGSLMAQSTTKPLQFSPGFQMWAVKDQLAVDFDGTLSRLADMGYKRIEAAGWQGFAPLEFTKRVRAAGLDPVSCHFSMRDLMEGYQAKLDEAREVGVAYLVASSPSSRAAFDPELDWIRASAKAMTLADWRENALRMNEIGAAAKAMGMRFAYHNHPAEFLHYDGVLAFHEILRLTDPALVAIELDIGWVAAAGLDPAEVIGHHAERVELLHIKDIASAQRDPNIIADDLRTVPIGSGTVDWPAVFAAAERAPIKSWFVEQEPPSHVRYWTRWVKVSPI